jgi:hypothetical protein
LLLLLLSLQLLLPFLFFFSFPLLLIFCLRPQEYSFFQLAVIRWEEKKGGQIEWTEHEREWGALALGLFLGGFGQCYDML